MMFYEELKQRREALGISIEQIGNRTKINPRFIEAIEAGDFSHLPETYIRLFLKAYTNELNIESGQVLKAYEQFCDNTPSKPLIIQPESQEPQPPAETARPVPPSKKPNLPAITIIIVILLFTVMIVKQIMLDKKQPAMTFTPLKSPQLTIIPEDTVIQAPQPPSRDLVRVATPPVAKTNLILKMVTRDSCWLKMIIDSKDTSEATFRPGASREWSAREQFEVRLGRPNVVDLSLNGKHLGALGSGSIPIRLVITADGIVRRQSLLSR